MPDVTVSGNVDTMMRAANNAAIRSAIGLGQTDAPTFLAINGEQAIPQAGLTLTNTTAASAGLQQTSPSIDLVGSGWKTTASASSQEVRFLQSVLPVQGTTNPTGLWQLQSSINGSAPFTVLTSSSAGVLGGLTSIAFNGSVHSNNLGVQIRATGGAGNSAINGIQLASLCRLGWASGNAGSTGAFATFELILEKEADGILAQRNGTAKQTLRIYNTYTSATVYERAVMDWNGPTPGNLRIGTEFMGSGSGMAARPIDFVTGGVVRMSIGATGEITLVAGTSFGGSSTLSVIGDGNFRFSGRSAIYSGADGNLTLFNNFSTGFNLLTLGGTTSAAPAIKRVGTELQVVIASTAAAINVAAVDADLTFIEDRFRRKGAGTPEGAVTAPVGAVYHRTDSGANPNFYVKESGSGANGWVGK